MKTKYKMGWVDYEAGKGMHKTKGPVSLQIFKNDLGGFYEGWIFEKDWDMDNGEPFKKDLQSIFEPNLIGYFISE